MNNVNEVYDNLKCHKTFPWSYSLIFCCVRCVCPFIDITLVLLVNYLLDEEAKLGNTGKTYQKCVR